MGDVKESHNVLHEHINGLREQPKVSVIMSPISNRECLQELLNSHREKFMERNDAFEAMVMALNEETMATLRL
ncbi:hypothetical protein PVK06_011477 [Gossypium arboreum]|uniref:Uncharacterized protein n=1 Tax=Gossypium arboreum TaxID=29729 RepID=A0ABR0Q927_GOSAR|nr:hypothetical protein PVK06_011477 [Gossypium arboreum]